MNKVAFVSGSSRGIGKSIALKFANEGFDVIINCSKSKEALLKVQDEIKSLGVNCLAYVVNISNYNEVNHMFEDIYLHYKKIDVLVNNAGISHIGLFSDLTEELWDNIINTNLKSLFNCCKFTIGPMVSDKCGNIINISSMWGITGASCEVAYSASKGGVNSFTKALAKELGPCNIRINAISCGIIDTEMNNWLEEDEKQDLIDEIPLMRLGKSSEIANLCYFLSTNESSYLTGQIISLDGGIN